MSIDSAGPDRPAEAGPAGSRARAHGPGAEEGEGEWLRSSAVPDDIAELNLSCAGTPRLSVVVPTRNEADSIELLLDRLSPAVAALDAELIVYGATEPNAKVSLQGEPVKLRPDGTFTMRFSLPDSRQIIPAVAASADGVEERTIVLAVERNTKHLDPMIHDQMNEV